MKKLGVLAVTALVLSSACSKPAEPVLTPDTAPVAPDAPSQSDHKITFDHPLVLRGNAVLTPSEKALVDRIARREALDPDALVQLFVDKHARAGGVEAKDLSQQIEKLARSVRSGSAAVEEIKPAYEAALQALLAPRTLDYLSSATTIPSIFTESALQCYSGTALFTVIARTAWPHTDLMLERPVVIYQAGHILPGFVRQAGKRFKLEGIETTASGRAIVNFGYTDEIDLPIRVVDANDWTVVEILKSELAQDGVAALVDSVLNRTAETYRLPLARLEAKIRDGRGSEVQTAKQIKSRLETGSYDPTVINSSPFGFGTAEPEPNRKPRLHFDRARVNGGGGVIVESVDRLTEDGHEIIKSGEATLIEVEAEPKAEPASEASQGPEVWVTSLQSSIELVIIVEADALGRGDDSERLSRILSRRLTALRRLPRVDDATMLWPTVWMLASGPASSSQGEPRVIDPGRVVIRGNKAKQDNFLMPNPQFIEFQDVLLEFPYEQRRVTVIAVVKR